MDPSQLIEVVIQSLIQMQYLSKILWFLLGSILISEVLFRYFPHLLKQFGAPFQPIVKSCNLPIESACILISSIGSSLVANGAIANLYKNNKLSNKQTAIAAILNSIPTYFRRLLTFYSLVIIPLFGFKFFLAFAGIYCACIIPKYIFCVIYGKTDKNAKCCQTIDELPDISTNGITDLTTTTIKKISMIFIKNLFLVGLPAGIVFFLIYIHANSEIPMQIISWYILFFTFIVLQLSLTGLKKQLKMFNKIAITMLILTFIALMLINTSIIDKIDFAIIPVINFLSLNENLTIPLLTFTSGQLIAGAGVLSNMISNGLITSVDAFLAITLGMIINLPIFSLRHIFPSYTAIFGKSLGFKIALIGLSIVFTTRLCIFISLLLLL